VEGAAEAEVALRAEVAPEDTLIPYFIIIYIYITTEAQAPNPDAYTLNQEAEVALRAEVRVEGVRVRGFRF